MVKGGLLGLWAWMAYGVVESIASFGLTHHRDPSIVVAGWQWPLIAEIFGVYMICGFLAGAVASFLAGRFGQLRSTGQEALACLTLTLAFIANLCIGGPLMLSGKLALATATVLAILLAGAARSAEWQRRTAFLVKPWIVSLLLLYAPWTNLVALPRRSSAVRTGATLFLLVAIVGSAFIWSRIRPKQPSGIRRLRVALAAAVAAWIGVLVWPTPDVGSGEPLHSSTASGKPNVLLITMDTVRADHLSAYGYRLDTSPNLKELANHATVFGRAISPSDYTLPSHASIFTGKYPSWHGAYPMAPDHPLGQPLPQNSTTLARIMATNGYWSAGVFANSGFLGVRNGMNQGFDVWANNTPVILNNQEYRFYLRNNAARLIARIVDTNDFNASLMRASDVNRQVNRLLDKTKGRPFFFFVNYMDAHVPYAPPRPFSHRFAKQPLIMDSTEYADLSKAVNQQHQPLRASKRDEMVAQYDSGIAYLDAEIGKLLARLRQSGLYDNTLILITSDHGDAFVDHNLLGHGVTAVYQEQVHVPLIVKYPGQHDGQRSEEWVSLVDIMPTVLDVAGLPRESGLQGQSLRSPRDANSVPVFTEARTMDPYFQVPPMRGVRRALFAGPLKLITWSDGSPELYDLNADPSEAHNLFRPGDPSAAALVASMTAWTATIPRQISRSGPRPDPATIERLKSLGYIQ
jgi:arylsulfatase A-like enzyme